MTVRLELLKKISSAISGYFAGGLVPESDTISFIKSAYGITRPDEIASLIEAGEDGGSVVDMVSYPPDNFREPVECLIPAEGLSPDEIKRIEEFSLNVSGGIFILFSGTKISLTEDDSLQCYKRFIQRLNLEIPFNYFGDDLTSTENPGFYKIRSLLRKKKFIPGEETSLFIKDLIRNYRPAGNYFTASPLTAGPDDRSGLVELVNISVELFNNSGRRPFEILTEKKYYYESAVVEYVEFERLLKTCSMEFIMAKRIRPPLVSIDEARSMVEAIDRLTSAVYGMIIPSVRNVLEDF